MKKPTETALVSACLKALAARRIFAWRVNAGMRIMGATKTKARRVVRMAPAGAPDIMLIIPDTKGQLGQIECKMPRGRIAPSQVTWRLKTEALGCRYLVVYSVSQCLEAVNLWRNGL